MAMSAEACGRGGTFHASLPVRPQFIFTRVSDGITRVFDFGLPSAPLTDPLPPMEFHCEGSWLRNNPGTLALISPLSIGSSPNRARNNSVLPDPINPAMPTTSPE